MSCTAWASTLQAAACWGVTRTPSASPPVGVQVISPATISESPRTVMSTGGEVEMDGGGWSTWAACAGTHSIMQANSAQGTISARR